MLSSALSAFQRASRAAHLIILAGSFVLAAGSSAAEAESAPRVPFTSTEDHFSADFPGSPKLATATGANGLPVRTYTATFGQSAYMVAIVVYPYNSIDYTGFPGALLDGTQKGQLASSKATMVPGTQHDMTLQGRPAREYLADRSPYSVKVRIVFDGRPPQKLTVFQVLVIGPGDLRVDPDGAKFLESFRVAD